MTPSRNVRVPTNVWGPAKSKAQREGTTLAAKINEWLTAYLQDGAQTAAGPSPGGDGPVHSRRPLPRT